MFIKFNDNINTDIKIIKKIKAFLQYIVLKDLL